jgi:Uncharacterized protein conserved in bacteria
MFLRGFLRKADPSVLNALSLAGTIGLHLVSGIAVGLFLGYLADKWLDTAPWGLGIGMIAGIIAGFKNVYTDAKRLIASQNTGPSGPGSARKAEQGAAEQNARGAVAGKTGEASNVETDSRND